MLGTLYLCATPIGNLEDITFRAVRTLKEVDLIAAEDSRHSMKLLNHFDIRTPITSYHEFNKSNRGRYLIQMLKDGMSVALITDAGTPGISDPGEELVADAYKEGITVTSVPGPAACISALILSGLSTRRFAFEAFLPTDKKERQMVLEELKTETRTIILYEAPHKLLKTLEELFECLGDRRITLCKELTKIYETVFQTSLSEAVDFYQSTDIKGEFVLVIEGRSQQELLEEEQDRWKKITIQEHMDLYINEDMDKKDAMKAVAKDRGISKRDVYQELLGK